jgi:hypothetical protein
MSDYNFDEAFDDNKHKKEQERRVHRAKAKPGTAGAAKKKDIKKFKTKSFKGDPRTHFRIIDCCATCKYSVFPKNKLRRGYCNLATIMKFRKLGLTNVLKVNQKNLARNEVYAKYNWVRVHATNYCTKHWLDEMKIKTIIRWIEGP